MGELEEGGNRTRTLRYHPRKIPEHGHPLVRFIFEQMNKQQVTYREVEQRSGVAVPTMKQWQDRANPNLLNIEAVLNVLGYTLLPVRKKDDD